jgi:hypothetical protein
MEVCSSTRGFAWFWDGFPVAAPAATPIINIEMNTFFITPPLFLRNRIYVSILYYDRYVPVASGLLDPGINACYETLDKGAFDNDKPLSPFGRNRIRSAKVDTGLNRENGASRLCPTKTAISKISKNRRLPKNSRNGT